LREEQFDLILCCAENARHAEVVEACAVAGTHVVVEKPMASSLAHGLRMARAAQAAGTEVIVNWPTTWSPAIRKAKELLDGGAIGRVIEVKWRGGHLGPLGYGVSHPGVSEGAGLVAPERNRWRRHVRLLLLWLQAGALVYRCAGTGCRRDARQPQQSVG
jgi:predicted dehydrogenase